MTPLTMFLLAGAGTFLIRFSAVGLVSRGIEYPPWFEKTLRMIAPAVLAAIAANSLILDGRELSTRWSWYASAAVAAGVAWRWKSAGLTMLVGMVCVWAIGAV